ncbi:MAG: hypothetical protein K2X47_09040, partial [Bdellovibrionales bacterium]|nr:hypothetical protein [Bdellovibrionales bacterium]
MKVQVFYPFFPIPRTEAAHHLVIEQMEAIAQLGHEVELVYWLGPRDSGAVETGVKRSWKAKYIGDGVTAKESVIQKGLRVVKALWQGFATTEEFHYPAELFSKIKAIQDVDLQIFHYSFVWKMLKDLPKDKVRRAVYFQNLESDLFSLRAVGEKNPLFRKVHEISALRLKS